MEFWSAFADAIALVAGSFSGGDIERYVPMTGHGLRILTSSTGEMKVPATVDGDTVALVDSMDMKNGQDSFQPNPFWGSQAHLVRG